MTAVSSKPGFNLEALVKQVEGQRFPPVDKWNPDFCGDIDMVIKRDGTWFYMGTPIGRKRMVKLFSSVLRKDEDGKTYLVTPVEKIGITVEDAPFVATMVDIVGEGDDRLVKFTTNVGDEVIAGPDHPVRVQYDTTTNEPRPYVHVRGRLEALISRNAFYEMVEKGDHIDSDGKSHLSITSRGAEFPLGTWDEQEP